MLASLDSPEPRLLIDDATNAAYVEPGYLLYGRAGELYAWRFDAKRLALSGRPLAAAEEKLSAWEPKNLTLFAASDSGTIVYLPAAVPKTVLQWYDPGAGRSSRSARPASTSRRGSPPTARRSRTHWASRARR